MTSLLLRLVLGFAVGFALAAGGCSAARTASPGAPETAPAVAADPVSRRRGELFEALRALSPGEFPITNPLAGLLRGDEYGGALDAGRAVEFFAAGESLRALLFAQAAVGADPGNGARRTLLHWISRKSGLAPEPEGELPRGALVRYELSRAREAFFEERFGRALQRARRAILLDADSAEAWKARASAELALGDAKRAKASYAKAAELAPGDAGLRRFLRERGWR